MRWKRTRQRREEARASYSAVHPDVSLAELHQRAAERDWRDDPRNFSDFGEVPGDFELAAEIDADEEQGISYFDAVPQADERAARFNDMLQQDQERRRTPRETWKAWRAYGRRHGTEHPEQAADRIQRHHAAEAGKMTRIDASTAGRVQNRFDPRTSGNVASNASASRRLNARHAEQPPPTFTAAFNFEGESFNGGPYRSGRPAGQRPRRADYAWHMEDGFR